MDYRRIYVQAIVLNGHHVLMVRPLGGVWALPGGDVEEGETPEDAVRRTVAAQTGADVRVTRHLSREKRNESLHRMVLTFLAEPTLLKFDLVLRRGTSEVDWRSLRSEELKETIYEKHLSGKERK
ncbi:MAG: hypothetical protein DDT37_00383 [Firmicutes bacterium]|nr:hypothetical protein [candidate division NPL-UPA2 bacterium]